MRCRCQEVQGLEVGRFTIYEISRLPSEAIICFITVAIGRGWAASALLWRVVRV